MERKSTFPASVGSYIRYAQVRGHVDNVQSVGWKFGLLGRGMVYAILNLIYLVEPLELLVTGVKMLGGGGDGVCCWS